MGKQWDITRLRDKKKFHENRVKQWENNGKTMGKQWDGTWVSRHIKTTWENNGKTMGKQWDRTRLRHEYFFGETRVEQWENNGKTMG
jgi:hypothetical protein